MFQGNQRYLKILDSRQGELSVLSDKTIGLVVLSVYVVYILGLFKFLWPASVVRKANLTEIVIALHSLCFFGFFISLPKKTTIVKGIVLCAIIPFACCMVLYTTSHAIYVIEWKLPLFLSELSIKNIVFDIFYMIEMSGLVPYLTLCAWLVSLPLLVIFGVCVYLSRLCMRSPETKKVYIFVQQRLEMNLFVRRKFVLLTGVVYIAFAVAYAFVLKFQWGDYFRKVFEYGIPIYIFSFFSILYAIPFIINNIKQTVLSCLLMPVFWSTFVGVIYMILIFVLTSEISYTWWHPGIPYFEVDVFTFRFYLVRYLGIQAWFISFPLLLICGVYYHLAKSELSRKAEMKEDAPSPELSEGD